MGAITKEEQKRRAELLAKGLKVCNKCERVLPVEQFSKDKTKNLYYKTFFRLMLISLFVLRQLFQKNIDKNYFMDKRISIVRILFQIAGYKHGKNASTDNLMLDMFNETGNYDLIMDDNDSKQNILKPLNIIYSLDKNSNKENNDKSKLILEVLKKGYI